MKDTNMKSEHGIMLDRLQKWRAEKGKSHVNKCQPASSKQSVQPGGIVKKPLRVINSSTKIPAAVSRKSQGSQSIVKKPPIQKARRSAPCKQQKSPETPMSKRLELWKSQKQKKSATKYSATKAPWKGGGTPAIKHTPNTTCTSTGKQSVERHAQLSSSKKDAKHSEQKERPLSQNKFSTSKKSRDGNDKGPDDEEPCLMQPETEIVQTPVPPTNLSNAFDNDDYDTDGDGTDEGAASQNLISRTDTPVMSEEDDDDLILNSSLEFSPRQTNFESVDAETPFSQTRKRKTPDRTCRSALMQNRKVARTEQKSVAFTTPLRCSPRLAKVGEGAADLSATPKNKKDMRDRLQQWLLEKGKTPSRFSNLLSFPKKNTPADRLRRERLKARRPTPARHIQQSMCEAGAGDGSARDEVVEKLNATLSECLSLLHEGCPVDHVTNWLDDICRRLPIVEQCAKYWLCRATATEIDGDYDDVIGVFEEAAETGAQPVDEIKEGLKELVMRMAEKGKTSKDGSSSYPSILNTPRIQSAHHNFPDIQNSPDANSPDQATPKSSPLNQLDHSTCESPDQATPMPNHLINQGLAHFSGLRYCLTDTTPLFKRVEATPYFTPGLMITPVRRSVRLESRRSFLPDNLKDHDICVSSLEDLPAGAPTEFILRSNRALEGEFADNDV